MIERKGPTGQALFDAVTERVHSMSEEDCRSLIDRGGFDLHFGYGLGLRNGMNLWFMTQEEIKNFTALIARNFTDFSKYEELCDWYMPGDGISSLIINLYLYHSRQKLGIPHPESFSRSQKET